MRPAAPPLLLLLAASALALATNDTGPAANVFLIEDFGNQTVVFDAGNDTVLDIDGEHEPVVRKKRTFGDIVFRGLADVLGYNVARKPPQAAFPPPLAPVPGIDLPLQAAPAPAPAPSAAPAVAPPPCGAPRAAAPPPCRAQRPPATPKPPPPCPRPRAAPRPKRPPPPPPPPPPPRPPPPPPCGMPRANPTTPSPCAPAPPPAKADNLETISSNFQLNFNFNRNPATTAPAADIQANVEPQQQEDEEQLLPIAPIAIQPRAARLPPPQQRKPRVYVDAFLLQNGVAERVDTVDANRLNINSGQQADDDYLAYDDNSDQLQYDDYEDAQESRDRAKAVREFGTAVDQFWENKKQKKPKENLPANHYKNVHFGDRDYSERRADVARPQQRRTHQSLQRDSARPNRIPLPLPEADEEEESTTTTEDPRNSLKPKVLPPTEHNPGQIDTVTVRVPPIYKEKRPKKLHRGRPDREEETDETSGFFSGQNESDAEGDDSWLTPQTEAPVKRKRRRKQGRQARSAENAPYTAGDYDYYGNKVPVSDEEKFYQGWTIPTPTVDADVARHEQPNDKSFLADHERIREDPERQSDDDDYNRSDDDSGKADESGRADESERSMEDRERSTEDKERTSEQDRADERERSDRLSPNARVRETGYQNNYVRATNVQVEDPRPAVATVRKKTVKIGAA